MLGFLGMLSGMLALTAVLSYWISWDMQPEAERNSFARTVSDDLTALIAKWRNSAGSAGSRSPAARPDRAARSPTRQALGAPARSAGSALIRS
jgi:hypothetical protein